MVVSVIAISFFSDMRTELLSDTTINEPEAITALNNTADGLPAWMDSAALFILVGLIIFVIASSFFIDTHPVFLVLGFIILLTFGVVWVALEKTGEELFGSEAEFVAVTASMPMTTFIMQNFFKIMIALPFLVILVLYAKGKVNSGFGGPGFGGGGI